MQILFQFDFFYTRIKKSFWCQQNDDWNLRRLFCFITQIFRASYIDELDLECENHICIITEKCINVGEIFIEFLSWSENSQFASFYPLVHADTHQKVCLSFMLHVPVEMHWMCATSKLIGRRNIKAKFSQNRKTM